MSYHQMVRNEMIKSLHDNPAGFYDHLRFLKERKMIDEWFLGTGKFRLTFIILMNNEYWYIAHKGWNRLSEEEGKFQSKNRRKYE